MIAINFDIMPPGGTIAQVPCAGREGGRGRREGGESGINK